VDSTSSAAYVGLGELYLSQGLISDAGKCFASALVASPQLASAHNGWGRHLALLLSSNTNENESGSSSSSSVSAEERAKQRAEAIASLEEACALEPSNLQFVADLEDFTSGPSAEQDDDEAVEGEGRRGGDEGAGRGHNNDNDIENDAGPSPGDVAGGRDGAANDDIDEDALWAAAAEEVRADEEARAMASRLQGGDDDGDRDGIADEGEAVGGPAHDVAPASGHEQGGAVVEEVASAPAPTRTLSRRSRSSSSSSSSSGGAAAADVALAATAPTAATASSAAATSSSASSPSTPPPPEPPLLHAPASPHYSPAVSPEPSREPSPAPLPHHLRHNSTSPEPQPHSQPEEGAPSETGRHTPTSQPSPPPPLAQQSPPESSPLSPADFTVPAAASATTAPSPVAASHSPTHLHHPAMPAPTTSTLPAHSDDQAASASSSSNRHEVSAVGRWGEVQLLGGDGAWKSDARRFLAETFGFVEVSF